MYLGISGGHILEARGRYTAIKEGGIKFIDLQHKLVCLIAPNLSYTGNKT